MSWVSAMVATRSVPRVVGFGEGRNVTAARDEGHESLHENRSVFVSMARGPLGLRAQSTSRQRRGTSVKRTGLAGVRLSRVRGVVGILRVVAIVVDVAQRSSTRDAGGERVVVLLTSCLSWL